MAWDTISGILLLLLGLAKANFLAIRQSDTGYAELSLMNNDNELITTSNLSFQYSTPHIEATATDHDTYYVVSFPNDDPNGAAHLWELDFNLTIIKEWIQPADGLLFFDLQYSSQESNLFGIAVNGTYGRVVSYINISTDEVTANYVAPCPYMWYVNASTMNHDDNIYYGLLNHFNNESAGQKLFVVNVTDGLSTIFDYNVTLTGLLYYITFTSEGLYAMSTGSSEGVGYATLGHLSFGTDDNVLFQPITTFDGLGKYSPIFASTSSSTRNEVCTLVGNGEGIPQLACYDLVSQSIQLNEYLESGAGNPAAVASFYINN